MCYISVRPERHSYDIIRRTGEFVINLTTEEPGTRYGLVRRTFRPRPRQISGNGTYSGSGDRRQGSVVAEGSPVDRMPRTTDPTVRIARPVSGRSGEYPGRQPLHRLRNG